jgi:hypothetical protein
MFPPDRSGGAMCAKCDEIETTISRYRRLQQQINDQQAHQAAEDLIAKLDAQKRELHPEQE